MKITTPFAKANDPLTARVRRAPASTGHTALWSATMSLIESGDPIEVALDALLPEFVAREKDPVLKRSKEAEGRNIIAKAYKQPAGSRARRDFVPEVLAERVRLAVDDPIGELDAIVPLTTPDELTHAQRFAAEMAAMTEEERAARFGALPVEDTLPVESDEVQTSVTKIPTGFDRIHDRFNRTSLSEVDPTFPEMECHGTAYRGWPSLISGGTGSGKTLVCRWLLLEAMRSGLTVGHADQEMGAVASKQYYMAMGLTDREVDEIAYWDMPSPTAKDAADFVDEVRLSVDVLLMDKVPDFLRASSKVENSNDDVNSWMALFVEPLRDAVTTLLIDATGWEGKHSRGGSEKDFKVALAWMVEVIDEPRRNHIGLIRWTCTKDRFGAIGRGTSIEFAIGGNGRGGIEASILGVVPSQAPGALSDAELRKRERDDALRLSAVSAARKHAPDEVRAISRTQLAQQMGALNTSDKYRGIDQAISDFDPGHKEGALSVKPNPRGQGSLVWWRSTSSVVPGSSEAVPEPAEIEHPGTVVPGSEA